MIVASLYNLPLTVLKSSASASVADRSAKIASVVAYSFTLGAFCLFCSPHGNHKMMRCRSVGCVRSNYSAFKSPKNSAQFSLNGRVVQLCGDACHGRFVALRRFHLLAASR